MNDEKDMYAKLKIDGLESGRLNLVVKADEGALMDVIGGLFPRLAMGTRHFGAGVRRDGMDGGLFSNHTFADIDESGQKVETPTGSNYEYDADPSRSEQRSVRVRIKAEGVGSLIKMKVDTWMTKAGAFRVVDALCYRRAPDRIEVVPTMREVVLVEEHEGEDPVEPDFSFIEDEDEDGETAEETDSVDPSEPQAPARPGKVAPTPLLVTRDESGNITNDLRTPEFDEGTDGPSEPE